MSATLYPFDGFNPVAAEWGRTRPVRRTARTEPGAAVGYRGGPLPGLPMRLPEASPWRERLLRWLAEMPRDLPPRD